MKLKDCTYGILVQNSENGMIGMVVGLTNMYSSLLIEEQGFPENAIPLVRWQTGKETGINHCNIVPLK